MILPLNSKECVRFIQHVTGQSSHTLELTATSLFNGDQFSCTVAHHEFPENEVTFTFMQDQREIYFFGRLAVLVTDPENDYNKFTQDQVLAEALYRLGKKAYNDIFVKERPLVSLLDLDTKYLDKLMEWGVVLIPMEDFIYVSALATGAGAPELNPGDIICPDSQAFVDAKMNNRYTIKFPTPRRSVDIDASKLNKILLPPGSKVLVWDTCNKIYGTGEVVLRSTGTLVSPEQLGSWLDFPTVTVKIKDKVYLLKQSHFILGILRWGPHEMPRSTQGLVL